MSIETVHSSYSNIVKKSKNAVVICHAILFCVELGAQSIDVIWAVFAQGFGLNSKNIGWIGFGFYIAVGFGDILFGTLADKLGFPLVVSITVIIFALCCLLQGILSSINIIAIISILSGFANCSAVLKLGFTTYILPHSFVVKYQVIAAVCSVFASCVGPLITAIIVMITDNYKSLFYFYAVLLSLLFIASLYNVPNERQIIKLQTLNPVSSTKERGHESGSGSDHHQLTATAHTMNINQNRNFQVTADKEMEFPSNLYDDNDQKKVMSSSPNKMIFVHNMLSEFEM